MEPPGALSPSFRAAHALNVNVAALAEETVELLYREDPALHARYGPAGRAHCVKDVAYHVRVLSAAVEMNDAKIFTDYAAWAVTLLASRGIPADISAASLRALREVAANAVGGPAASFVRETITSALHHAESGAAAPRPCPPRRWARLRRFAGADASVDGSIPSHF